MLIGLFELMARIHELKTTARTGWNMEFPPDHKFKTRRVPEAESVADHSYGLAIYAFALATELGLDVEKTVTMALVHDAPELITLDIVTATLGPEEKAQAQTDKRLREEAAARTLFLPHGAFGARCFELWLEFEDQKTEEARLVRQLDKFECAAQAVFYAKQGHQVDPLEFVTHAAAEITHPLLVEALADLRRQCGA